MATTAARGRGRLGCRQRGDRVRRKELVACKTREAKGERDDGPVRRTTHDAAELPRFRRRRRDPVHPRQLAAGVGHAAGGAAAAGNPRRRAEGRHPHARRAGGVRRRRAREGDRDPDLRHHRRGDRARRFRPLRQAGADLEGLGAAAQPRAAPPAGALVPAHRRGPAIPAGALPDRAARRLRPLAPLQRAGSVDADARREAGQASG